MSSQKKSNLFLRGLGLSTLALSLASCVDSSYFTNIINGGTPTTPVSPISTDQGLATVKSLTKADKAFLTQLNRNPNLSTSQLTKFLETNKNPYVKNVLILQLVNKLIGENKLDAAKYYLGQYTQSTDANLNNNYAFLASKVGAALNDQQLLSQSSQIDAKNLTVDQQLQAVQMQLVNDFRAGKYGDGLNKVNEIYNNLSYKDKSSLVDSTLQQLMTLNEGQLNSLAEAAARQGNTFNVGWFRLAQLAVANKSDSGKLNDAWSTWMGTFKDTKHPASITAPSLFKQTSLVSTGTLKRVGVLLPLTDPGYGAYAETIRHGIDQANQDAGGKVKIQYYDTKALGLNDAYSYAVEDKPDIIIGPLTKPNVVAASRYNLPVRDLMLNIDAATANVNACYTSTMVEFEADRLVELFKSLKIDNPVIIASNSASAKRAISRFSQTWLRQKQQNVRVINFSDMNQLQSEVTKLARSTPRPKGIVFFGNSEELVKVKQFWTYTTQAEVVVAATSSSNEETISKSKLGDIEGVYFTENALVADPDSILSQKAKKSIQPNYVLLRLYGYGYDAFNIAQNFNSIKNVGGYAVSGNAGTYAHDASGRCHIITKPNIYQIQNSKFIRVK